MYLYGVSKKNLHNTRCPKKQFLRTSMDFFFKIVKISGRSDIIYTRCPSKKKCIQGVPKSGFLPNFDQFFQNFRNWMVDAMYLYSVFSHEISLTRCPKKQVFRNSSDFSKITQKNEQSNRRTYARCPHQKHAIQDVARIKSNVIPSWKLILSKSTRFFPKFQNE